MESLFEVQAKADVEKFRQDLFQDKLEFIRSAQPSQIVLILEAVEERVGNIYDSLRPTNDDELYACQRLYKSLSQIEDAASFIRVAVKEGLP